MTNFYYLESEWWKELDLTDEMKLIYEKYEKQKEDYVNYHMDIIAKCAEARCAWDMMELRRVMLTDTLTRLQLKVRCGEVNIREPPVGYEVGFCIGTGEELKVRMFVLQAEIDQMQGAIDRELAKAIASNEEEPNDEDYLQY